LIEPKTGDYPRGPVPCLAVATAAGPLAESFNEPVRPAFDRPLRQVVPDLVVLAPEIRDRVLDPVSFRPDLVRLAQLALQPCPVGSDVGQGPLVHLDRGLQELASFAVRVTNTPEPARRRLERRQPLLPLGALPDEVSLLGIELVEACQRPRVERPLSLVMAMPVWVVIEGWGTKEEVSQPDGVGGRWEFNGVMRRGREACAACGVAARRGRVVF